MFVSLFSFVDADTNPQTLLFSATCPPWVYDVAKKYMRPKCKHIDLIGKKTQKAATTVEVSVGHFEKLNGTLLFSCFATIIVSSDN